MRSDKPVVSTDPKVGGGPGADLLGRGRELGFLVRALENTASGHGGVTVLEGEPGIGKTVMLRAVHRLAAEQGMQVRGATAGEIDRHVPFAAVAPWLRGDENPAQVVRERAQSLQRDDGALPGRAGYHIFAVVDYVLTVIEHLCAAGPVVLLLDDMQWADTASLRLMGRLAELVGELPLFVAVAIRSTAPEDPAAAGLNRLCSSGLAERLELGPLTSPDVDDLVERTIGCRPDPTLTKVLDSAGGNPLYICELLAELKELREIEIVDGSATCPRTSVQSLPRSLVNAIARRLTFLSAATRHVLAAAAALGGTIEPVELAAVLGVGVMDVWGAADAATNAGLLIRTDESLVFRHDVVRQVFADQVPDNTRRNLHWRAAQRLMQAGAPPERVAHFLLAGNGMLESRHLDWLVSVVETLVVRTPETTVELLDRALAVAQPSDTRDELLLWRIQALMMADRPVDAESAANAVLAVTDIGEEHAAAFQVAVRWQLVQAQLARGKVAESAWAAEIALAQAGLPGDDAGRFHGFRAMDYFLLGQLENAEQAAKLATSIGEGRADPVAGGFGYLALGSLRYAAGKLDGALDFAQRVFAFSEHGVRGQVIAHNFDIHGLLTICLIELDRFDEAAEALKSAVVRNKQEHHVYMALNLLARARLAFLDGRWDDALAEVDACTAASDPLGFVATARCYARLIAIHRGARGENADTEETDGYGPGPWPSPWPWVHGLTHESQGRPEQGLESLARFCDAVRAGLASATAYYAYPDTVRLAMATSNLEIARAVTADAEALAALQATASRQATADFCRGLVECRPPLLETSARLFGQSRRPRYQAMAYENLAAALAEHGRPDDARAALDTAIDLYSGLGCAWDIGRAESLLRQHGIRRGQRGPRRRPKSGWAALTPTEHKVALLVAEGYSNAEIGARMCLSRRTVQSHVSSILAKLGLTSRLQVAVGLFRELQLL